MSFTHYKAPCFALVDCNNFYVSCERLFNPKLIGKPVIVLSNNDGCVISRSNEAKRLGIKMGEPFFKISPLCKRYGIHVYSSNFALYGDISRRVMAVLKQLCPDMEVYSVDEAFLRIDYLAQDPYFIADQIRKIIWQHVGIPVSVGIAPTKTLAKVANQIAKKNMQNGVFDLRNERVKNVILQNFPVEDLWGVGKKWAKKLHDLQIQNASALFQKSESYFKKHFNVVMARLVKELKGTSCLSLEEVSAKQNILCSRSFGDPVTTLIGLQEAVSRFCAIACEKARRQKTKAQGVYVYFRTSPFSHRDCYYAAGDATMFVLPSNDTCLITAIAKRLVKQHYRAGFDYKKAGIVLLNMQKENIFQNDFFQPCSDDNKRLMSVLDKINNRFGRRAVCLASEGAQHQHWGIKQTFRSPRYTTCWKELPNVF